MLVVTEYLGTNVSVPFSQQTVSILVPNCVNSLKTMTCFSVRIKRNRSCSCWGCSSDTGIQHANHVIVKLINRNNLWLFLWMFFWRQQLVIKRKKKRCQFREIKSGHSTFFLAAVVIYFLSHIAMYTFFQMLLSERRMKEHLWPLLSTEFEVIHNQPLNIVSKIYITLTRKNDTP